MFNSATVDVVTTSSHARVPSMMADDVVVVAEKKISITEIWEELAKTKELVHEQAKELAALREELARDQPPDEEDDTIVVFAQGPEAGYNLFSFSVWEIMHCTPWPRLLRAWVFFGFLNFTQLILTFGFYDANFIRTLLSEYAAFKPTIDTSLFYAGRRDVVSGAPYVSICAAAPPQLSCWHPL